MNKRSPISTHVLDTMRGCAAAGIAVEFSKLDGSGIWQHLGGGITDMDGRIAEVIHGTPLAPGRYRLTFDTGAYFASQAMAAFYPSVVIEFEITSSDEHYHVPLLLSPFGYSTYRGT